VRAATRRVDAIDEMIRIVGDSVTDSTHQANAPKFPDVAGEVARMVGEIATRHAFSKDVIAGVSERSGGVPLFVEEVTRLLLERGEAGGVQAIPPTL
jgi:hypothetical protein